MPNATSLTIQVRVNAQNQFEFVDPQQESLSLASMEDLEGEEAEIRWEIVQSPGVSFMPTGAEAITFENYESIQDSDASFGDTLFPVGKRSVPVKAMGERKVLSILFGGADAFVDFQYVLHGTDGEGPISGPNVASQPGQGNGIIPR